MQIGGIPSALGGFFFRCKAACAHVGACYTIPLLPMQSVPGTGIQKTIV